MVLKQRATVFCQRLHIFNTLNFYIHWHVNLILVVSILNQNLLLRKYRFHQKKFTFARRFNLSTATEREKKSGACLGSN